MIAPINLPYSPELQPYHGTRVISIHSNKGGVGKTALTTLLTYYLAHLGYRVISIDYDGQHNLSNNFGLAMSGEDSKLLTIQDVLQATRAGSVAETLEPSRWMIPSAEGLVPDPVNERVRLVPGYPDLDEMTMELLSKPDGRFRLREGLADCKDEFDFVLIDCPPGKGLLPESAWAASDHMLGVSLMYYNEIEGVIKSRNRLLEYRSALGVPTLDLIGVVVNQYQSRRVEQQAQLSELQAVLDDGLVWNDVALPEREFIRQLVTHSDRLSFGSLGRGIGTAAQRRELDDVMARITGRLLAAIGIPIPPDLSAYLRELETSNA